MANNIDTQYQALLQDILDNGVRKGDRTGTGTISVFGRQIRHKMSEGFPLLTTKKMAWKTMVTELLWFLRGDTNIKYLVDNDCHIWDGDAYKNYVKFYTERIPCRDGRMGNELKSSSEERKKWGKLIFHDNYDHGNGSTFSSYEPLSKEEFIERIKIDEEFEAKWGELGPIYGKQWRRWDQYTDVCADNGYENGSYDGSWTFKQIDQIANLIKDLKTNPDSRRLMVSAWNVGEINSMVLPPCHYGFQVYTRELSFNNRYRLGNYQPYNIEGKVEYENGLNYITKEQFERFHNSEMDKLNIPTRAISLIWNQRSVDVFLGLPFNIASYGLLLVMIACEVNMVPEHLIGHLGDTHLYLNHLEQVKEQMDREPKELPILKMSSGHNFRAALKGKADEIDLNDFILLGYDPHPTIKAPLSN